MKTKILAAAGAAALLGAMTPAERAAGRYMRGPDGHLPAGGGLDLKGLQQHFDRHHGEVKDMIEEVKTKLATQDEQLTEIEQKMARGGGGGAQTLETLGERFVASENFKNLAGSQSQRGRAELQTKATITSSVADAAGSAGALATPHRDGLVMLPRRRLTVRSLIPVVNVSSGSVEVPRVKARTNNAGMVAEGAAKPGSDLQIELETLPIRTIAHWMKASRQVLDDAPQLRDLIDGELMYGLALKEEAQLLTGDGTGQNLTGMIPQATAYAAPITIADANMIDQIGLALLQSALAEFPADGIVMHPSDWLRMQLLKDGEGRYILGAPNAAATPQLWGVPVVPTQAMSTDKFLVGNFQSAATIYDRWTARVEVATENEDDFVKNLLTILGEERIGLAVKQPKALTYGDFGNEA